MNERWRREGGEDRGGNTHGEAEWIIADRQDGQADNGRGPLPRDRDRGGSFAFAYPWLLLSFAAGCQSRNVAELLHINHALNQR